MIKTYRRKPVTVELIQVERNMKTTMLKADRISCIPCIEKGRVHSFRGLFVHIQFQQMTINNTLK